MWALPNARMQVFPPNWIGRLEKASQTQPAGTLRKINSWRHRHCRLLFLAGFCPQTKITPTHFKGVQVRNAFQTSDTTTRLRFRGIRTICLTSDLPSIPCLQRRNSLFGRNCCSLFAEKQISGGTSLQVKQSYLLSMCIRVDVKSHWKMNL